MDTARTVARLLTASATAEMGRRTAAVERQRRLTTTVLVIGGVFAVLLGLVANAVVLRGEAQRGGAADPGVTDRQGSLWKSPRAQ